jgi:hypothetical protein
MTGGGRVLRTLFAAIASAGDKTVASFAQTTAKSVGISLKSVHCLRDKYRANAEAAESPGHGAGTRSID